MYQAQYIGPIPAAECPKKAKKGSPGLRWRLGIEPLGGMPVISQIQRRGAAASVIAAVVAFAVAGCSSQSNPQCADTIDNATALTAALTAARQSVNDVHDAQAKAQSQAIEKLATACIEAGDNADNFHYIHAFAAMIEAQARMASGDVNGLTIFQNATDEAKALAGSDSASHDLREMAKNLVTMASAEMNEIQHAKRGALIKPPPSPTPE